MPLTRAGSTTAGKGDVLSIFPFRSFERGLDRRNAASVFVTRCGGRHAHLVPVHARDRRMDSTRSRAEPAIQRDEDDGEVPAIEVRLEEPDQESGEREPLESWQER